MKVKIIVACDENGAIGNKGELLWQPGTQRGDMKHFKETTTGHVVLMGRKTWESIPDPYKPLSKRINVIASTTMEFGGWPDGDSGHRVVYDLLVGIENIKKSIGDYPYYEDCDIYIMGGGEIYKQALEAGIVDEVIITMIYTIFAEADTYFPLSIVDNSIKGSVSETYPADKYNAYPYHIERHIL